MEIKDKKKDYKRGWYLNNIEITKRRAKIWREKNPEKKRAQSIAQYNIPLKEKYEICNSRHCLQRHHWRYDKLLLVNTLCNFCHKVQHIRDYGRMVTI